ncbi:hypothetical protein CH302_00145 [Rhodococcus sp. 15-2388-1-1a]|nr:hypothetical protein CH302_00145 [Rhodococcus sp. 15-2388-1-1a]
MRELERVAAKPSTPTSSGRFRPDVMSPGYEKARALVSLLAERLPVNLRGQFATATAYADGSNLEDWARYSVGLASMILLSGQVLAALDGASVRHL